MTEKRKQSPHYIAELDPENRDWLARAADGVFAYIYWAGFVIALLGIVGVMIGLLLGVDTALLGGIALGVVVLILLMVVGG